MGWGEGSFCLSCVPGKSGSWVGPLQEEQHRCAKTWRQERMELFWRVCEAGGHREKRGEQLDTFLGNRK